MPIPTLPEAISGKFVSTFSSPKTPPVRILFVEQLSLLIGKSATTIRTFATNEKYKHLIPRPFKMPHSRRLCWYEHEVLAWIESHRPANPPPENRPRGRPTKAEQLERQRWAATQSPAQ
jgi:predicted DNA-binding transcriptional regulator AlpA